MTTTTDAGPLALALILLGALLYLAVFIWNVCLKQGRTGYSVGKGVLGIKLVKEETGQPHRRRHVVRAPDRARARQHPATSATCGRCGTAKRQTFADKVIGTVVVDQPRG